MTSIELNPPRRETFEMHFGWRGMARRESVWAGMEQDGGRLAEAQQLPTSERTRLMKTYVRDCLSEGW